MLAAPEDIEHFCKMHPDVPLYTAAIDNHLDEHGYIIPGLGDAGDPCLVQNKLTGSIENKLIFTFIFLLTDDGYTH